MVIFLVGMTLGVLLGVMLSSRCPGPRNEGPIGTRTAGRAARARAAGGSVTQIPDEGFLTLAACGGGGRPPALPRVKITILLRTQPCTPPQGQRAGDAARLITVPSGSRP